jgi:hypothetical protein
LIIHKFKCSTKSGVLLLVPTKEIPEAAKSECSGAWTYAGQLPDDFKDSDIRLAIDSQKAATDIKAQGYHIAKYRIGIKETVVKSPKK